MIVSEKNTQEPIIISLVYKTSEFQTLFQKFTLLPLKILLPEHLVSHSNQTRKVDVDVLLDFNNNLLIPNFSNLSVISASVLVVFAVFCMS